MRDKARFAALKVEGLKPAAGNILKQEALSLGCDAAVARGVINCSVETTDAVIMGTMKQLRAITRKLRPQPFGLKVLGEEIAELLKEDVNDRVPLPGGKFLDLSSPAVMGIVNVTPDSFSDGGDNYSADTAVESALRMVEEGADVLDIGGESTRPGSEAVSAREELSRILPVIEGIATKTEVPISVDTTKAEVAREAIKAGAAIINDISGLNFEPDLAKVAADTGAPLILMHMRGKPRTMQSDTTYRDLVGEIYRLLADAVKLALDAGVERERIIIDPGIGFGKSAEGNLALVKRISEFNSMGLPVLVGASRKSFIGSTLGIEDPKDRLEGGLAVAALAVNAGAKIIRTHDVMATRRAVDLAWAVAKA
ncbi:MAG: dihydropteroate synthase [Deltaproteobacteria bacterium]|nr:MAG: dihydropteroate synthase [Deltaproteobacteria bacterium]